jgi:Tripartite tricarboxylate transporter TctB family
LNGPDRRSGSYRREEFALIGMLLLFFLGIVVLSYDTPFDARLFPLVVGSTGIVLTVLVAAEQLQRRAIDAGSPLDANDPADRADWPRYATALLSAPVFGLLFWLFGFVVASLAAMLLMPALMGYQRRRQIVVTAVATVAVLAVAAPYLLNVDLPHGLIGEWLVDRLALRPS